jgi:hypothetical protein
MNMSPKIWTLIAGASLGLLMSAACTVTSVDDDGSGGTGVGGGTTTTTTSNGGSGGDGGGGVGGGGTCAGCADTLYAQSDDLICGGTVVGDTLECDADSSCELLVDLFVCACVDDGSGTPGCETECSENDEGFCQFYVPSTACETCLAAACAGEFGACSAD